MRRTVVHVRTIDEHPNEWARLISEIVDRPGWSRQRLADTAKVHRHTIRRWISGESANVSSASVRLIAEAAGVDYETAARAAVGAQEKLRAEDDAAVRMILDDPDASDQVKKDLIAYVRSRREESEDTLLSDLRFRLGHPRPQTN